MFRSGGNDRRGRHSRHHHNAAPPPQVPWSHEQTIDTNMQVLDQHVEDMRVEFLIQNLR